MLRAALTSWTEAVGLAVDEASWARLETLVQLWQRYGPALNLLGAYDADSLVEHVREGLAARRVGELAAGGATPVRWLDIGSGGGLPGLVIAATSPWEVVLVEPRAKRAGFLDLAAASISGGVAHVARARWGDPTWERNPFLREISGSNRGISIASARAVWSPEEWLKLGRRALPPRGIVVVHVGFGVEHVGTEPATWRIDAGRWSVLGFRPVEDAGAGS